ncbi:NHL repeat-containing protein [Paraburkholderia terrae]|uniref:NHL repeat-containing protein n=1 Tax=Paraburkholderia terrae TaxID=311230 RepID=UPI0020BF2665|nr:NHL repeat-containing protein [Paraburkholderia terrae]
MFPVPDIDFNNRSSFHPMKLLSFLPIMAFGLSVTLAACGGGSPEQTIAGPGAQTGRDGTLSGSPATPSYTIGGFLTGLAGGKVVLLDNNADALTLNASGAFSFATPVAFNSAYAVSVGTQPIGFQWCSVTNGSGTATANVSNVAVSCAAAQALVSTLAGSTINQGSGDGKGASASFYEPYGIAVDASGNLYVAEYGTSKIRKITPDGTVSTLAGSGTPGSADGKGASASFNQPTGIAVDVSGNLYVADYYNNEIRKVTPDGTVSTLAGSATTQGSTDGKGASASFFEPSGIAVDGSGNLYVAEYGTSKIRKITPDGTVSTLAGSGTPGSADGKGASASFNQPTGIAVDASGNLYVADYYNNEIRKVTPDGTVSTLAGSTTTQGSTDGKGASASFYEPSGIAVDASGNLYVAEYGTSKIRKITPDGTVSTLAGSGTPGSADGKDASVSFNQPTGIAVDVSGNLYVADYYNNEIRKITPVEP